MRRTFRLVLLAATFGLPAIVDGAPAKTDVTIPAGSGDYRKMLRAAQRYREGGMSFDELTRLVVAAHLPPHKLGCAYLFMPVPAPPPGTPFDPRMMPSDWQGTFGEVAMTYFAGVLTRDEIDRLHRATHGALRGFPACRLPGT